MKLKRPSLKVKRPSPVAIRRGLTALSVVMALTGVGFIGYPFATDLWAARIQSRLVQQLAGGAAAYRLQTIEIGDALTKLEIPRLGVDTIVVEGATQAALYAGAGHYPETPLPGEVGNVAIAGHRTTFGKPFARMDELVPGDKVVLTTPLARHVYEIDTRPWVVDAFDWSPVENYPLGGSFLTLTSCHPEGSATQRIVVRAHLVESSDVALASMIDNS
ncbi:MAG: class E sortase [Actinomycetota bacterium]